MNDKQKENILRNISVIVDYPHLCTNDVFIDNNMNTKHVSILHKGRKCVASAVNIPSGIDSYTGHAERQVIDKYIYSNQRHPRKQMQNLTLTNIRFTKDGEVALSKPCPICKQYILFNSKLVSRVQYIDAEGNLKTSRPEDISSTFTSYQLDRHLRNRNNGC